MRQYEIVEGDSLSPVLTFADGGLDGFTVAYNEAKKLSVKNEGSLYRVDYRGPDAPWGRAEIGFALNGEWRWR